MNFLKFKEKHKITRFNEFKAHIIFIKKQLKKGESKTLIFEYLKEKYELKTGRSNFYSFIERNQLA